MHIRKVNAEDAAGVAELIVNTWRAAYHELVPRALLDSLSQEATERRWRELLSDPATRALVCEDMGRIDGLVTCGASRDDDARGAPVGEIYVLYVRADRWGRGYGRALLAAALEELRALGLPEVTLWTLRGNQRAIRFYEREGFVADGTTQRYRHSSGVLLDEVRYRRRIAPAPCGQHAGDN